MILRKGTMHHQLKEAGFVLKEYKYIMDNGLELSTYAYPLFELYNIERGLYMKYYLQWGAPYVSNPDSIKYGDQHLYIVGGIYDPEGIYDHPGSIESINPDKIVFEYVITDPDNDLVGQYDPNRTPGIPLDMYFNDSQVKEEDGTWIFKSNDFLFMNSVKGGIALIPTRNGALVTIENNGVITSYEKNSKYMDMYFTPVGVPRDSITRDDLCVFTGASFIRNDIFYNCDALYTSSFDVEAERYLFAKEVIVGNQKFIHCTHNIWLNEGPVEMDGYREFIRPEKQRLYGQREFPINLKDVTLDYHEIQSWKNAAAGTNAEDDMTEIFNDVEVVFETCSNAYDIVMDPSTPLFDVTALTDDSFNQASQADDLVSQARELGNGWGLVIGEVAQAREVIPSNSATAESYAQNAEAWNAEAQLMETSAERALEIVNEINEYTRKARHAANKCAELIEEAEEASLLYRKALELIDESSQYLNEAKEASDKVEDLANTLSLTLTEGGNGNE